MHFTTCCSQVLLASVAIAAWSDLLQPAGLVNRGIHLLEARQTTSTTAKSSFNLSPSIVQGETGTLSSTGSTTGSQTGSQTGSVTATGSAASDTKSSKTTTSYSATVFNPVDGPGGISMITPNPISGATYYKISDSITFAWNYTSVSILPSAIDILAVGASNSVTYTLATNQSVTATTGAFTWDTKQYQSSLNLSSTLLSMQTYTMVVHDAAKDVSATPVAGYLGTANQFRFVMYQPSPYIDITQWKCATCSAASSLERQTVGFILGMAAVTVISFTWFAGNAGIV